MYIDEQSKMNLNSVPQFVSNRAETDLNTLGTIPDHVTVAQSVNQIEVLQQADVFLTHCGMNSVNETLYYKVPLVLFPQTVEQGGGARLAADKIEALCKQSRI